MADPEPQFIVVMRAIFAKHGSDYDSIQERLNTVFAESRKDKDRMSVYSHFYYYICARHKADTREELQIVGMTSLIEGMMADVQFKDPFQYFDAEFKGQNSIEDVASFKKAYYENYGATKKIVKYFNDYISKEDTLGILRGIMIVNKETSEKKPLEEVEQFAKFLYQMRSDFVHNANMRNFCPADCFASLLMVGNKVYDVRVSASAVLDILEKSFVAYWQKKYESLA